MTSLGSPSPAELEAVMATVKPRLAAAFARYGIQVEEAALIVEGTMLALLYKWEDIEARENWLWHTVERRCRRLAQSRGREVPPEPSSPG